MGELLLLLVVALTVAAIVFGVAVLITGGDRGLAPVEPDGRAVPLPGDRPLVEADIAGVRFDTALRGYRMAQVDQALRRAAYDIGYKDELIGVLEAEVAALREGRLAEADVLRRAREAAAAPRRAGAVAAETRSGAPEQPASTESAGPTESAAVGAGSAGDQAAAPDGDGSAGARAGDGPSADGGASAATGEAARAGAERPDARPATPVSGAPVDANGAERP